MTAVTHSVYIEALKIATTPGFEVEVVYSTELENPLWAVKDTKSEFWFEAFDTKDNAIAFCSQMSWTIKSVMGD